MNIESPAKLRYRFEVLGQNFTVAGEVSSKIKRILQQIGAPPDTIRRTSVATYEAEMNVVIHADGGEIILEADAEAIRVIVADRGPGIEDVEQAMQPGFSTASEEIREMGFGAGMGLSNIARCADELSLDTKVGVGTTLRLTFRNATTGDAV